MQSPPSYSHSVTLHARSQVRSPTQLGRQPAAHSPNFASDFSTAQPPAYLQSVGCGVCGVGFGA
jgi:hypothetical protein